MSERIEMAGQCGDDCIDVVWCTVVGRCKLLGIYTIETVVTTPTEAPITYPEEPRLLEAFVQPLDQG